MTDKLPPVADDLMIGADVIAVFLYGNDDPKSVRDVYRNPMGLSFFKHGNSVAGFKSTIRKSIPGRKQGSQYA